MRTIDLNADLGEGGAHDAALIPLASSANIACGGHAGYDDTMRAAIELAIAAGTAIGAHPGYEDREHFGRRFLNLPPEKVRDMVSGQVERLAMLAAKAGAALHHVKPHGALYLQAGRDAELARAVAEGVRKVAPGCGFYVPPGGALAIAGAEAGLLVRAEGFADRRYGPDGQLQPRSESGAVIEDIPEAAEQALEIALSRRMETLCVHGDGPRAVEILGAVRRALEAAGFTIQA